MPGNGPGVAGICPSCGARVFAEQSQCERCLYPLVGMASSQAVAREDERRFLTVLFCDLVNYSSLAEELELEQQTAVVREYRRLATEVVTRHGGFVAQYLGDGLLCYFDYPISDEDGVARALQTGLELVAEIERLGETWPDGPVSLRARVGVHTGVALIGREQLAVGPTVNCAARVQELARPSSVLVTGAVYRAVAGFFEFAARGEHALKGFAKPFSLYEVRGVTGARDRIEAAQRRGLAPFVDRRTERALLERCWQQSCSELCSVLLTGEPGIGKSRTLHEFRSALSVDGQLRVLEARCSEQHASSTLFPLLELIRAELGWSSTWSRAQTLAAVSVQLTAAIDGLGHGSAEMMAGLLAPTPADIESQLALGPLLLRERMLGVVVDFLVAATRRAHVLLVIEDLQWADPTTLAVCSALFSRRQTAQLMIVASARPDFTHEWTEAGPQHVVQLDRLGPAHVDQLIGALAQHARLPAETAERIALGGDGNPLFIEEITRDVLEAAEVASSSPAGVQVASVPLSLRSSLRARLDRLGRRKRLTQQAAVLGREFDRELLCRAFSADGDAHYLDEQLRELVDLGILLPRLDRSGQRYEFRHALIHNEAYESLARTVSRGYHARVARTLLSEFPALAEREPEVLGQHLERAGQFEDAVRAFHRAGQSAVTRAAFVEARALFERALSLLSQLPHSEQRDRLEIDVRAGLGVAQFSTLGFSAPEVEDTFQRAMALSERFADTPIRLLYGQWVFVFVRGDRYGTSRLLPQLQRAVVRTQNALEELVACSAIGSYEFMSLPLPVGERNLARAWQLCDKTDTAGQNAVLLRDHGYEGLMYPPMFLAWMRVLQGRVAEAEALIAETLPVAEASRHPYLIASAYGVASAVLRQMSWPGGDARCLQYSERVLQIAEEHRMPYWIAWGLCEKGEALVHEERVQEGCDLLEQGLLLLGSIGAFLAYPYYMTYFIGTLLRLGRWDEAERHLRETLDLTQTSINVHLVPALHFLGAELAAKHGDLRESYAACQRALALAESHALPLLGLRVALRLAEFPSDLIAREDVERALHTWMAQVSDCSELTAARALLDHLT